MRTYLVDGTNAARRHGYDPRFQEMEELHCRRFLELVARSLDNGSGKISVEVVFDGPRRSVGDSGAVLVRFAGPDTADAVLLGSARAVLARGKGVVVVTEDGGLAREIEDEGGKVIGFSEFLERLRRGRA